MFRMPHIPFSGPQISPHTMVVLTDTGRRQLYNLSDGGRNLLIAKELDAHQGSMTVMQISRALPIDIDELKNRLRDMRKAGVVRFGGEMDNFEEA